MTLTLARLRADAIRRTLFPATTLTAAIRRLGFVQADPIRAPARAQDLILERRYASLDIRLVDYWRREFRPYLRAAVRQFVRP